MVQPLQIFGKDGKENWFSCHVYVGSDKLMIKKSDDTYHYLFTYPNIFCHLYITIRLSILIMIEYRFTMQNKHENA